MRSTCEPPSGRRPTPHPATGQLPDGPIPGPTPDPSSVDFLGQGPKSGEGEFWLHDHAGPSPLQGPGPLPSLQPPAPSEPLLPLYGAFPADAQEGSSTMTRLPALDFQGAPPHFGQMVESWVGNTFNSLFPAWPTSAGIGCPHSSTEAGLNWGAPLSGNSQRKHLTTRGSLKGFCYQRWGGDGGGSRAEALSSCTTPGLTHLPTTCPCLSHLGPSLPCWSCSVCI